MPLQVTVDPPQLRPIPPGSNLPALTGPPPPPRVWTGWLAFAAVLVLVLGGGWFGRNQLVALWPPVAQLYLVLGLPVQTAVGQGLSIGHLTSLTDTEGGVTVLVVRGEVANSAAVPRALPKMRIALRDAKGQEVYHWVYAPEPTEVPAHGSVKFTSRLSGPPAEASDLQITFVDPADAPKL